MSLSPLLSRGPWLLTALSSQPDHIEASARPGQRWEGAGGTHRKGVSEGGTPTHAQKQGCGVKGWNLNPQPPPCSAPWQPQPHHPMRAHHRQTPCKVGCPHPHPATPKLGHTAPSPPPPPPPDPIPLPRGPAAPPCPGKSSSPRRKTWSPQRMAKPRRLGGLRGASLAIPALPGAVTASARRRRPCLPSYALGSPPLRPVVPRQPHSLSPACPARLWPEPPFPRLHPGAERRDGGGCREGAGIVRFYLCCGSWPSRAD